MAIDDLTSASFLRVQEPRRATLPSPYTPLFVPREIYARRAMEYHGTMCAARVVKQ